MLLLHQFNMEDYTYEIHNMITIYMFHLPETSKVLKA